MDNKSIIKTSIVIILITCLVFVFYLIFIKPHVTGTYMPTLKDCEKAYDCTCVNDGCMCTYSKWFIENKIVCDKTILKDKQIEKWFLNIKE